MLVVKLVIAPVDRDDGQKVNATESCVDARCRAPIHFQSPGMPHIDHYVANTRPWLSIRNVGVLHDGTAERPMLAFTSGETAEQRCVKNATPMFIPMIHTKAR